MSVSKGIVSTLALAGALAAGLAHAQQGQYPSRPIKLVVGQAPGGSSDIVARVVGKAMAEHLKVPIVIDNKGGANTILASNTVAKSAPDGYTLLMSSSMNATNPWVYEKLPYDYKKDLVNIGLLGNAPNVIVASLKLPANNWDELISYAKKNPGKLSYGTAGIGSTYHLLMEAIALHTGTSMTHIPYKGGGPAVVDVVGGNLDVYFGTIASTRGFVERRDLKPIVVAAERRSKYLPEVGTFSEAGLKGFNAGYWMGVAGPAGLAPEVITKINSAINAALKNPSVLEAFEKQAIEPLGGSPEDADRFFQQELKLWRDAAAAAKLTPMSLN